jgi:hypothetical protein
MRAMSVSVLFTSLGDFGTDRTVSLMRAITAPRRGTFDSSAARRALRSLARTISRRTWAASRLAFSFTRFTFIRTPEGG